MTIIFDLDGTLLNTIDDLGYACNYALEQTGYPTHPIEDYPRMVGNGINNLIRRALPESERTEEHILRVRAHFVPYYNDHNCGNYATNGLIINEIINMKQYEIISDRQEKVLRYLDEHNIPFTTYNHPEGKTIDEAKRWWHDDGSVHCKNIFMRNHKGDQHYLICFPCDYDLAIHDIEHWLKDVLVSQGLKAPGKLSFASPERMMRYLGLEPGSVSPFGLINDTEHHVILFLDSRLKDAESLSFHPNDCRGTVVISQDAFQQYLSCVGNKVEYITTC